MTLKMVSADEEMIPRACLPLAARQRGSARARSALLRSRAAALPRSRIPQHLAGQVLVILGAVAGRRIGEDRLPKARTFRQLDVPPNPRAEHLRLGPGEVAAPALVQVILQIALHFLGQPRARLVH